MLKIEIVPISARLNDLRQFDEDNTAYVDRWCEHLIEIGGIPAVQREPDGQQHLLIGVKFDDLERERSLWRDTLSRDLDEVPARRVVLEALCIAKGWVIGSPQRAVATAGS